MSTYSAEILKQGIEQGIKQGIEQGIEQCIEQGIEQGIKQGIEQGIKQGIEQCIVKLLKKGNSPEFISENLEIPMETILQIGKKINISV